MIYILRNVKSLLKNKIIGLVAPKSLERFAKYRRRIVSNYLMIDANELEKLGIVTL